MKRRSFLTMLGLSPVVAAVPAVAAMSEKKTVVTLKIDEFVKHHVDSRIVWYDDGSMEVRLGDGRSVIRARKREGWCGLG